MPTTGKTWGGGRGWQFGFPDEDRAMVLAMDLFAKSLNSLSLDLLSSSIK